MQEQINLMQTTIRELNQDIATFLSIKKAMEEFERKQRAEQQRSKEEEEKQRQERKK